MTVSRSPKGSKGKYLENLGDPLRRTGIWTDRYRTTKPKRDDDPRRLPEEKDRSLRKVRSPR